MENNTSQHHASRRGKGRLLAGVAAASVLLLAAGGALASRGEYEYRSYRGGPGAMPVPGVCGMERSGTLERLQRMVSRRLDLRENQVAALREAFSIAHPQEVREACKKLAADGLSFPERFAASAAVTTLAARSYERAAPEVRKFYSSLNAEQKEKLDMIGARLVRGGMGYTGKGYYRGKGYHMEGKDYRMMREHMGDDDDDDRMDDIMDRMDRMMDRMDRMESEGRNGG